MTYIFSHKISSFKNRLVDMLTCFRRSVDVQSHRNIAHTPANILMFLPSVYSTWTHILLTAYTSHLGGWGKYHLCS
jgi:hypothetical protein